MTSFKNTLLFLIIFIGMGIFISQAAIPVEAATCPRNACTNNCDQNKTECVPDANGNPRPCSTADQGWWCISPLRCDQSLPGKVEQRVFFCDGTKWVDKGTETPASDCGGFCGGPEPTPDTSGIACKDRPFRVWFQSTRRLGPAEKVTCEVNQTSTTCEPCIGLSKHTQCEFGTSFEYCATAESDCLCKHPSYTYSCKLNGVPFTNSSGDVPDPINAKTSYIVIDPPGGSVLECKVGNSCNNCNGNTGQCYPDCGGGTCRNNVCISCPNSPPSACSVGQSCNGKCNSGDTDKCYPGCNGGVCNANGKCDSCFEAGYVPPATPTPVQAKTVITIAPTFTPAGANTAPPQKSQRWVCLETTPCSDPFSKCSGQGDSAHRVSLSTGKSTQALANRETYIFECLIGLNGPECTSGSSANDQKTIQQDMFTTLKGSYGYDLQGFFKQDGTTAATNPLTSGTKGEIPQHEWQSVTSQSVGHVFFAMNEVNPNELTGSDTTSKQSTFIMDAVPYTGCVMITSDPYGKIFDSQTLEPIKGAKVTLLKKNKDNKYVKVTNTDVLGGITNPVTTTQDGSFSFRVPDGTYKLAVEAKGYAFPAKKDGINKNYSQIFSNLYYGGVIVQKGKIVQHDIPLTPLNSDASKKQSANTKPTILALNQSLIDDKKTTKFEGVVSHPLSHINIYGKKPNQKSFDRTRVLTQATADKQGKFVAYVKQDALGYQEMIGDLEVLKEQNIFSDATNTNQSIFHSLFSLATSFIQKVMGEENKMGISKKIEPILGSLEGYTYDEQGNKLVNATVEIHLPFSNNAITHVTSNNDGYFKITSEYLPNFPYTIRYITVTGRVVNKTPSQFILDSIDK